MSTKEIIVGTKETSVRREGKMNVRMLTCVAMLSALAYIIMLFDTSVPLMPFFIKLDFSDLPELIATFAYGPVGGVLVCLIKNLLSCIGSTTKGIGELSNFILGVALTVPSGLIYQHKKNKKSAIIAVIVGMVCMAVVSFPSNLFLTYPVYTRFMKIEDIVASYQAILTGLGSSIKLNSLAQCLLMFNVPFTLFKGACSGIITMVIYKHISPILKGNEQSR